MPLPVLAEQVWDPLSRSQTSRLVEFLHRLRKGYPTVLHGENKYTQVLPACSYLTNIYFSLVMELIFSPAFFFFNSLRSF